MTDSEWQKELHKICEHFNVLTAFSYLSWNSVGPFINALPENTTVYQIGLTGTASLDEIQSYDLIFNDKIFYDW